jgi:hypothetical protein
MCVPGYLGDIIPRMHKIDYTSTHSTRHFHPPPLLISLSQEYSSSEIMRMSSLRGFLSFARLQGAFRYHAACDFDIKYERSTRHKYSIPSKEWVNELNLCGLLPSVCIANGKSSVTCCAFQAREIGPLLVNVFSQRFAFYPLTDFLLSTQVGDALCRQMKMWK